MNLIIVESPTKARTLSRFLGKDYLVEATTGHIKDLPKSKLSVDVEHNFQPDYQLVLARKKSIALIKKQAKRVKQIYLATDPDREGEAIAKHVEEILTKNRKQKTENEIKRIVFHEITKSAVEKAINNPGVINKNKVDAQIARRVLDRLVGYKLSPLLWKKVRRGLSAGRVQSVTVRLIVEREREIEAFRQEEYWEIFAQVVQAEKVAQVDKEGFIIRLVKIGDKKVEVTDGKTAKKIVADLEKSGYTISDVKKREVKKSPYPPYTTSTLTQSAASLFGWSAKRTMSVAQKLYEKGLISYHRTDSTHMASAAVSGVRKFIGKEYGEKYLPEKARFYKTKSKSAQEAHEAIRPTDARTKYEIRNTKYEKDAGRLYELIWKRFVACQMANSVYDETKIEVDANVEKVVQVEKTRIGKSNKINDQSLAINHYLLRASGQIMKFDGWRIVYNATQNPKPKTQNGDVQLPDVDKDDLLHLIKVDPQQKFTLPPPRFNEASLIKTLEKLGIGRPSTYAPIITTIQLRNYVEKDERKFKPTPIGFAVNDFLTANFPKVLEYSFTAGMEDDLDNVAKGKRKWTNMMKEFYKPFEKKVISVEKKAKRVKIAVEKLGKKCPECKKGELVIRTGRFGKFISCSTFPDCKHTEKYLNKIGMKCLDCRKGEIIVKTTKKKRKFFGCSRYPKCKWASWKKPKSDQRKPGSDEKESANSPS